MIGAKDKLAARFGPRFSMNAKLGRQADEFVNLAQRLKRRGGHVDALIIQMGNNGPLYGDEMEDLRKATSEVGELFLVTDHAPVSWQDESNHALEEADKTWPHTTLIDWGSGGQIARKPALGRHPPHSRRCGCLCPTAQQRSALHASPLALTFGRRAVEMLAIGEASQQHRDCD